MTIRAFNNDRNSNLRAIELSSAVLNLDHDPLPEPDGRHA
jgi:hypothetical protein